MKKLIILAAMLMSTSAFAGGFGFSQQGVPLGPNGRDDCCTVLYAGAPPFQATWPAYAYTNGRDDYMPYVPATGPYVGEHYKFLYVGQ